MLAANSRICFGVHVFDGVSLLVADDKRLRQMVLNLLSNAMKFTPAGGEISIDVYRRGKSIAISVSDPGVGMREEDIATALEPFGQIENQQVLNNQGTGLGLPRPSSLPRTFMAARWCWKASPTAAPLSPFFCPNRAGAPARMPSPVRPGTSSAPSR